MTPTLLPRRSGNLKIASTALLQRPMLAGLSALSKPHERNFFLL
jgi:hypothetical protein